MKRLKKIFEAVDWDSVREKVIIRIIAALILALLAFLATYGVSFFKGEGFYSFLNRGLAALRETSPVNHGLLVLLGIFAVFGLSAILKKLYK